jgi:thiamine-monophosphate kinase
VGFELDNVPVAPEVKRFAELNSLDASELALYGGEEYELVLTVKPEGLAAAVAAVEAVGGQLLSIGKATQDLRIILRVKSEEHPIEARGWEHFKTQL